MRIRRFGMLVLAIFCMTFPAMAQEPISVSQKIQAWDTESLLDSLDQDKLPKMFTVGVLANANISNFMIARSGNRPMSSYLRVGADAGVFFNFLLTKHFAIQPQIVLTAEQNRFSMADTTMAVARTTGLWTFGADIPVYFLARFGNMQQGYLQFGGGVYTHFQFAADVGKPIKFTSSDSPSEIEKERQQLEESYTDLLKLHRNHFGVGVMVGYEFAFGMQINLSYKVSLSDICSFYTENKTATDEPQRQLVNASIYPQKISLGIGYRFR